MDRENTSRDVLRAVAMEVLDGVEATVYTAESQKLSGIVLTRSQKRALIALLSNATIAQAAKAAGLTERTLHRYLSDGDFKAELRKRQDQVVDATMASVIGMASDAVEALHNLIINPQTPPAVRSRTALGWLRFMYQAVEINSLVRRFEELEVLLADLAAARGLESSLSRQNGRKGVWSRNERGTAS